MLERYDPESAPDPETWIAADDAERLRLIEEAHRRLGVKLPNEHVHAIIHLIVENQVALGDETPAADAVQRVIGEGLTRHDALHAVGSVLMVHMQSLVGGQDDPDSDPHAPYFQDLQRLTAKSWREKFS